jgi:hypothetical protein
MKSRSLRLKGSQKAPNEPDTAVLTALPEAVTHSFEEDGEQLTAIFDDKTVSVKIIVDDLAYHQRYLTCKTSPGDKTTIVQPGAVAEDGNEYLCVGCGNAGEIVCCDGCPRVYHVYCLPAEGSSKASLDADDDPWYCPECWSEGRTREDSSRRNRNETSASKDSAPNVSPSRNSKRKRQKSSTWNIKTSDSKDYNKEPEPPKGDKKRMKKRKTSKRKKSDSDAHSHNDMAPLSSSTVPASDLPAMQNDPTLFHPTYKKNGLVQATPAFYFFLTENRWKVERALVRSHRYFNRLPRGPERNELVANEAASWWLKLRPTDQRRYINMSMRDFEHRIIAWKEEKSMNGTIDDLQNTETEGGWNDESDRDDTAENEQLKYKRYESLYLDTSVGSKPYKPEHDQHYNRVLLDLLHDMRFHSLPMVSAVRPESEPDYDPKKVILPYFDVIGPVATSVGDECLGCTRGWAHFCPVLKRRVPAVECRAKLQPPMCSLMATRVGLGLRPRLESAVLDGEHDGAPRDDSAQGNKNLFVWQETKEQKEIRTLSAPLSSTLSSPNERTDEVTRFLESTMAMKVPEPSRPPEPKKGGMSNRKLPHVRPLENDESDVFKCGRCRSIIFNDTGCILCRRAQLVIKSTKQAQQPLDKNTSSKVSTVMLARLHVKEEVADEQSEADKTLADAMVQTWWMPWAILPPSILTTPAPRHDDYFEEHVEVSDDTVAVDSHAHNTEDPHGGAAAIASLPNGANEPAMSETPTETAIDHETCSTSRTHRPTRTTVPSTAFLVDRDEVAIQNRNRTELLKQRCTSIACCGMLFALRRRDPLLMFAEPVRANDYADVITDPIDMGMIKRKVLDGQYSSLNGFVLDCRLLCENALLYNAPGSVYAKTAQELYDLIGIMQKRASNWIGAIVDAFSGTIHRNGGLLDWDDPSLDPFETLRQQWPDAVDMMENGEWLRKQVESDFIRCHENETAYYGTLAVRRVAAAAEASYAAYPDTRGVCNIVIKRTHDEDEALRKKIDTKVAALNDLVQLKNVSSWREESVVRLLRKVQSRRLERLNASESGCSRCDGFAVTSESLKQTDPELSLPGKTRVKGDGDLQRVDSSRLQLTTGLGSSRICKGIEQRAQDCKANPHDGLECIRVSVRGSKIHGWGLFADEPFQPGDMVAEYVGEYVSDAIADSREKYYRENRIQDYQFRIDEKNVIDATLKGGHGRYINHNCSPSCVTKIIPGKEPKPHLKRVIIVAQRSIEINEEITYDYQFPLELNMGNRIPCNCGADDCRGFMNWDIPEKGAYNGALLIQKRGANMRDRIRRLGRPLKRDDA